jgi:hypothetical protein
MYMLLPSSLAVLLPSLPDCCYAFAAAIIVSSFSSAMHHGSIAPCQTTD